MLKTMTLGMLVDELFRILPSRQEGAVDIASEIEIWERELADIPLALLDGTSRAFMRGDLGVKDGKGKHWRPTLPEFRQAAIKRGGLAGRVRHYPLLPHESERSVISTEDRQRICKEAREKFGHLGSTNGSRIGGGGAILKRLYEEGDREDARPKASAPINHSAPVKLSDAILSSLASAINAPERMADDHESS